MCCIVLYCIVLHCVAMRGVIILYCVGVKVDGGPPRPAPRSGVGNVVKEGWLSLLLARLFFFVKRRDK